MLGYGQHELLEFLDGIIGNFPADKAAHVEFGDGDRQPFPGGLRDSVSDPRSISTDLHIPRRVKIGGIDSGFIVAVAQPIRSV